MADRAGTVLRRTPYELVFGPDRFEAEVFPAIAEEAESRGTRGLGPESFVMLGRVGNLLRDLRPGDARGVADGPPAEAIAQYGSLTWHAWSFWREGRQVWALSEALVRHLIEDGPIGPWVFTPPANAGYVQLPRHRLWTRVEEDAPAEPVDGFHWTWREADPDAGRASPRIDLLLALGLRPGRGGLSVIEVSATPPPAPAAHWADVRARNEGQDFDNILPGGELQDYHGLASVAEVLKLVSRCFHWLEAHPANVFASMPDESSVEPDNVDDMPDSTLPFRAAVLAGEEHP